MERLGRDELLAQLESFEAIYFEACKIAKTDKILTPCAEQTCKQLRELVMNYDMVQQYRDEKEAEQAETELTYIEIILDLYERISDLCKQLEAKKNIG